MGDSRMDMARRKVLHALAPLGATCLISSPRVATAQNFPARPVDVIVPWGAGGGSDITGRMLARALEGDLKTSFPVLNVPGASGVIGVQKMMTGPADAQTICVSGDYYGLLGAPDAKFKLDDFTPLGILINQAGAIFVSEKSRFKTWEDVEKEARAKPGTISIAMAGFGIIDEIHTKLMLAKGLQLNVVPYPKPGERYVSILGNHVDLLYEQAGDVKSFLESKQMRPILSVTEKPFPLYSHVPTARSFGYDITVPQVRWAFMKSGAEPQRIRTLGESIRKMAGTAAFKSYLEGEYADPQSFVPYTEAREFIAKMLESVRREARIAGLQVAG
jgi:tripartite-type tricarboxylate transporter receptor subunit TctC